VAMEEAGIPADDLVGRIAADLFERRVDIVSVGKGSFCSNGSQQPSD
jgi:hypothetical protein